MNEQPSVQTGQLTAKNEDGQTIQISDTVGTVFLGLISFLLLMALLRAHKQIRKLLERQIAAKE